MVECQECSLEAKVKIDSSTDTSVEIIKDCCEEYLGKWHSNSTLQEHVIDVYCQWNDSKDWRDVKRFFDTCEFDIYVTCIPESIEDICWYETNDELAYTTNNSSLFGACK
jgi:hypothetical protein